MDRTTRYLFILLGFVLFLILAPSIVLYLSGTRLNFTDRDTEATGILVAKTNPNNATVFVNGEERDNTPATVRFLDRADYEVKLSKDGYFDWVKRLPVEPGKVTYTYEGIEAVEMIRRPEPVTAPAADVICMVVNDNIVWFGKQTSVHYFHINSPENITSLTLPITPRSLVVMRNSDYLLAENEAQKKVLINTKNQSITPLPDSLTNGVDLNITSNGLLLARIDDAVYSYNLSTRVLTPILKQVAGFTLLGNTGYVVHRDGSLTLQTVEWNGFEFGNAEPIFNSQLPGQEDTRLIITNSKELFALTGSTLYRINGPPEVISNHISDVKLDINTDELIFSTASELWFYNFIASKPQLLTRSTVPVNSLLIRSSLGYGFISSDSGLTILEIDSRDQQNRYPIISNSPVWAIGLSNNQEKLAALQGSQIIITPIR
jgi:hypothetical protein